MYVFGTGGLECNIQESTGALRRSFKPLSRCSPRFRAITGAAAEQRGGAGRRRTRREVTNTAVFVFRVRLGSMSNATYLHLLEEVDVTK